MISFKCRIFKKNQLIDRVKIVGWLSTVKFHIRWGNSWNGSQWHFLLFLASVPFLTPIWVLEREFHFQSLQGVWPSLTNMWFTNFRYNVFFLRAEFIFQFTCASYNHFFFFFINFYWTSLNILISTLISSKPVASIRFWSKQQETTKFVLVRHFVGLFWWLRW